MGEGNRIEDPREEMLAGYRHHVGWCPLRDVSGMDEDDGIDDLPGPEEDYPDEDDEEGEDDGSVEIEA